MINKKVILVACIFAVLLQSCGTTLKTFDKTTTNVTPTRTLTEVLYAMELNKRNFQYFNAKLGADVVTEQFEGGATIYLRMLSDQYIWTSISKLSFEVVRAMITKDSIVAINRYDRTYQVASKRRLTNITGLDIDLIDLQQVLSGNLLVPKQNEVSNFTQVNNEYQLIAIIKGTNVMYIIDPTSMLVKQAIIADDTGRESKIVFEAYTKEGSRYRPKILNITTDQGDQARIDVKEVQYDVAKEASFSIPSRYEKVYW